MLTIREGDVVIFSEADYHFTEKSGKWMYFFNYEDDYIRINEICRRAVLSGITRRCKMTSLDSFQYTGQGVCCFYAESDNKNEHRRIIDFFKKNDWIKKTSRNAFHNISFKLESQTQQNQYGSDYKPTIRLSDFMDLETGRWTAQSQLSILLDTYQ